MIEMFDIRAEIEEEVVVQYGEVAIVPIDSCNIWGGQIATLNDIAMQGVGILNAGAALTDKIVLINHSRKPFVIKNGDLLAQSVRDSGQIIAEGVVKVSPNDIKPDYVRYHETILGSAPVDQDDIRDKLMGVAKGK